MNSRLDKITFTGIDNYTKKEDLIKISKEFPMVEFGFLHSARWKENGTRHPNPIEMKRLYDQSVNYSLHLCGAFAGKALVNDYTELKDSLGSQLNCFNRMQLNVVGRKVKDSYNVTSPSNNIKQIIIQTADVDSMDLFDFLISKNMTNCVPLFDPSGGKGKYSEITEDMFIFDTDYFGIAGGINLDNCMDVVNNILKYDCWNRQFWIDMESSVRDNQDRFSTDICYDICKKLNSI